MYTNSCTPRKHVQCVIGGRKIVRQFVPIKQRAHNEHFQRQMLVVTLSDVRTKTRVELGKCGNLANLHKRLKLPILKKKLPLRTAK